MEAKMVESRLVYPFSALSLDNVMNIGKDITYNDKELVLKDSKLDSNNKLYIGLISYIKVLYEINNNCKDIRDRYDYTNNYISKFNVIVIGKVLELKKINSKEIIEQLKLNYIPNIEVLVDNIINAYEKENDVYTTDEDLENYQISKEKNIDSMNIESQKLLELRKK
ncbi:MAG TPA: hypothetical protein PLV83_06175 [Bacilli bacterium]|nr:hypothetical protein [Bacilli bacterium]